MDAVNLSALLDSVLSGTTSREEALRRLSMLPSSAAPEGDVLLDLDRRRRCGFPEVIYGEGKSVATIQTSLARLMAEGDEAFATRISPDAAAALLASFPQARYQPRSRTLRVAPEGWSPPQQRGRVAIVTAGTTDLPVAEEARETLDWMGVATDLIADVGVAGPWRLPAQLPRLVGSDAVVVVAGMEAALPSVVAGHVDCPVIGVPTSVGYGANLGGVAALLTMLNSCAAQVVVVNIDAGFKGGYVAGMIARGPHPRSAP
jgi:NCAIR mutase (PurE)-related protein